MTTLPQTSPKTRYPRTTNGSPNGHAVPAVAVPAAAPGGPPPPTGMTGNDVLRVLRQNILLILLSVIVALGAGFGVYKYLDKNHRLYTASGFINVELGSAVDPITGKSLSAENRQATLEVEQQTQVSLLTRESIVSEVLRDPNSGIRQTKWLAKFDGDIVKAKEAFIDALAVTPQRNTSVIVVQFDAADPKEAEVIVQDLITTHVDSQSRRESSDLSQELSRSRQVRSGLTTSLDRLSSRIGSIIGELGDDAVLSTRRTMAEAEREMLLRQRSDAEERLRFAEGGLQSFQQQIARGETPTMVSARVAVDPSVQRFEADVRQLDVEIKTLADNLGVNNPTIRSLQIRRDNLEQQLEDRRAEVIARTRSQAQSELSSAVESNRATLDGLEQEIDAMGARINNLTRQGQELSQARTESERKSRQLDDVESRIQSLGILAGSSSSSKVQQEGPVEAGDAPTWPDLKMIMAAALVLGLGLSLGLAFLREFMDTSVRSPRDISKVGQMNLLGMVPHADDDAGANLDQIEHAIARNPGGMMAEQFRQIRGRLLHAAPPETTRTLLITSPSPDDGKTTVASNLAAALALSGRRVLLVDANFRRPTLGGLFNTTGDLGFADVLENADTFEEAIQESEVPGLAVLAAGKSLDHPTEMMEGHQFSDFLQRAYEDFQQVVFDGGPVMLASESAAMAQRVDGVITVVRASTNSRGLLGRLRDNLRQLKAEHIGVVLNGVRSQAGGYYKRNMKTYYDYAKRPALKG